MTSGIDLTSMAGGRRIVGLSIYLAFYFLEQSDNLHAGLETRSLILSF